MAVEIALALNTVNGLLNGAEEKQITEAGRDLFTAMVLKTWIADAKEAIYEAEDLLIEIENEARRIEWVAGSQTGMYQVILEFMVGTNLRRPLRSCFYPMMQKEKVCRNTEWFTYPGVWTTYMLIVFMSWLLVLSIFGCSPGMAWTIVHFCHFAVTYHFFHWKKGTPFADDQGIYNGLTWWEQIENGKQLTRNRKFLTVVPVVLYLIASHTTDYQNPMLFFNTLAVFVLVVAKFPNMHKVRIFGINADH